MIYFDFMYIIFLILFLVIIISEAIEIIENRKLEHEYNLEKLRDERKK